MRMKIKHIIGCLLISIGMFAEVCVVGTMDYTTEMHKSYDEKHELVQGIVGATLVVVGGIMNRDLNVDEDDYEQK